MHCADTPWIYSLMCHDAVVGLCDGGGDCDGVGDGDGDDEEYDDDTDEEDHFSRLLVN